jgi:hypothetical protein
VTFKELIITVLFGASGYVALVYVERWLFPPKSPRRLEPWDK